MSEERDEPPLLLLDDVTGELDGERRRLLLEAVAGFDQAIVTTTDQADLGGAHASVLTVATGGWRRERPAADPRRRAAPGPGA